jgi:hypothetical protein
MVSPSPWRPLFSWRTVGGGEGKKLGSDSSGVLLASGPFPGLSIVGHLRGALKGLVLSFLGQRIPRMGQVLADLHFFWNFPFPGKSVSKCSLLL